MGGRINTIMQTCYFGISGVLPREEAIAHIKKSIEKTYGKRGPEVVRRNCEVVDQALAHLHEIPVPKAADATRKRPMPPLALPTREFMEHARKLWEELELPPLNVQAPWHGYTLEDWTDTWEQYARRTVAGDWEQTGKETLLRQRSDKMPEAPVRPGQNSMED